ncbi:hypothetical protein ACGRHY_28070 [Streptomyces sp. HK10]|uniref:hypothetical protein n=1 Tax=Streptomyces sp. HK10 TaxID=3373255 RepID=UPI0037497AB3
MKKPEEFEPGDRIQVIKCTDDHDPLPAGATGTVTHWNPHPQLRQLAADWDAPHNDRSLMLCLAAGDEVKKL